MKYILKKEYPGSPKLGNIIDNLENDWIENYPEFWEEVVEKDYEILSYRSRTTKNVLSAKLDPFVLNKSISWNDKKLMINSVQRLSDSQIFIIDDKIMHETNKFTINGFFIPNEFGTNTICVSLKDYDYKSPYLNQIEKYKQPLFKTEDGVDIFKGDKVYYIETDDAPENSFKVNEYTIQYSGRFLSDNTLHSFSTKEKAEEYILYNKPCLSLNDIKNILLEGDLSIKIGVKNRNDLNKKLELRTKLKIQQFV